jgi:acyl-CoA dehydrogenase
VSELTDLVADVVAGAEDPWPTLVDLGLTTIGVPESAGGSGGELADLAEVAATLGEHGTAVPLAEHATAAWAAARGEREIPELGTVTAGGPGKVTVPWASRASHVLLIAPGGPTGIATLAGLEITPGFDPAGQPLDDVDVPAAATTPLDVAGDVVMARLALLRAATATGAARGAYALTRSHVRRREQFGRPLVKLPAVATALARMTITLLQAETSLQTALADAGGPHAPVSAAMARCITGSAVTEIARTAHQLHGALGITEEYELHRRSRLMWATRDADVPEERWAQAVGEAVLDGGETVLWTELTVARTL